MKNNIANFLDARQFVVGFENAFRDMEKHLSTQSKFPPHDVIQIDDDNYQIVLAVAGFTKKDITVSLEDGLLNITGAKIKSVADGEQVTNYIYNGISHRSFKKSFSLHETVKVKSARVADGLLTIDLEKIVPDVKRAVTISID